MLVAVSVSLSFLLLVASLAVYCTSQQCLVYGRLLEFERERADRLLSRVDTLNDEAEHMKYGMEVLSRAILKAAEDGSFEAMPSIEELARDVEWRCRDCGEKLCECKGGEP